MCLHCVAVETDGLVVGVWGGGDTLTISASIFKNHLMQRKISFLFLTLTTSVDSFRVFIFASACLSQPVSSFSFLKIILN